MYWGDSEKSVSKGELTDLLLHVDDGEFKVALSRKVIRDVDHFAVLVHPGCTAVGALLWPWTNNGDTQKKKRRDLRLCLKSQIFGENYLTFFYLKTQEQTEAFDWSTKQPISIGLILGYFLVRFPDPLGKW